MDIGHIKTPLGIAELRGDQEGLASVVVLDEPVAVTFESPSSLQEAARQLHQYFEGQRKEFQLALNPKGSTFQKGVWAALREIPYGTTISYQELSKRLGNAKAIRAVASANGKNPLWVIIPCHRVIGSDGSLVGYAGGLHRKKWLLEHESPFRQGSLFPS